MTTQNHASQDLLEMKVETSFSNLDRVRADRLEREIVKVATQLGSRQVGDGFCQAERHLGFLVEASKLTKFCELVGASSKRAHASSAVKISIRGALTV
jgi:hypothetical protein